MSGSHVKYVLIGGGVASSSAVQAIRGHDREGSMVLISQEVNRPYHRPPLSKEYLLGKTLRADLFTLPDSWFVEHQVELRTGRRAARLDVARRTVVLDNGQEIGFERLLLATGATPRLLDVPGSEMANLFYLRVMEDADRLHNAVEKARREGRAHARGRGRAAVVGGGLLGVELSATLTQLGLEVEMMIGGAYPWAKFTGETAGRFMARYLETQGVRVHGQTVPLRLEGDGRVQRVAMSNGQTVLVDFVVGAMGIVPNRQLLRGTSIAAEKAILVDDHCRTNHPGIYAAGDCAAIYDPLFGKYRVLDHWESVMALGDLAGANMAGVERGYDQVSHFASEVFGVRLSVWGEARVVERRIVRGNAGVEGADFMEIGVASDGRVAQVVAINHEGEDEVLREMVRRRLLVADQEVALRDPGSDLAALLR